MKLSIEFNLIQHVLLLVMREDWMVQVGCLEQTVNVNPTVKP